MPVSKLSKYIILFLFAVLIVLSGLLAIYGAENKALHKANAVLKEQVALRDAAIGEIDKNIALLKEQIQEAEHICNERIQARKDVMSVLHINPPDLHNAVGIKTPTALNKGVISYEKSNFAVDSINKYWGMFTAFAGDSKK